MYKPEEITSLTLLAGFLRCRVDQIEMLKSKYDSVLEMRIPKHNRRYGYRVVYSSKNHLLSNTLKCLQFELNKLYVPMKCVGGFVHGRGVSYNAMPHINKRVVLTLDIKDFFESIPFEKVVTTLVKYGFATEMANHIAEIVTLNNVLVTGFNTSPVIANMCCEEMDSELLDLCRSKGLSYTRYADDLTFSGGNIDCIEAIKTIINRYGFLINEKKTRLYRKGGPQYVTGLTVSDDKYPRIPNRIKRQLRAEIYYIVRWGLLSHALYNLRESGKSREEICVKVAVRVVGWLNYINSVEPMYAKKYKEYLFTHVNREDIGFFESAERYIKERF